MELNSNLVQAFLDKLQEEVANLTKLKLFLEVQLDFEKKVSAAKDEVVAEANRKFEELNHNNVATKAEIDEVTTKMHNAESEAKSTKEALARRDELVKELQDRCANLKLENDILNKDNINQSSAIKELMNKVNDLERINKELEAMDSAKVKKWEDPTEGNFKLTKTIVAPSKTKKVVSTT